MRFKWLLSLIIFFLILNNVIAGPPPTQPDSGGKDLAPPDVKTFLDDPQQDNLQAALDAAKNNQAQLQQVLQTAISKNIKIDGYELSKPVTLKINNQEVTISGTLKIDGKQFSASSVKYGDKTYTEADKCGIAQNGISCSRVKQAEKPSASSAESGTGQATEPRESGQAPLPPYTIIGADNIEVRGNSLTAEHIDFGLIYKSKIRNIDGLSMIGNKACIKNGDLFTNSNDTFYSLTDSCFIFDSSGNLKQAKINSDAVGVAQILHGDSYIVLNKPGSLDIEFAQNEMSIKTDNSGGPRNSDSCVRLIWPYAIGGI